MLCQFEKLLYPKDIHAAGSGSYMVAVYRPCEVVRDSTGSILPQFKAVGYFLPLCEKLRYDFRGHWSKNPKHGTQFEVDSYDEVIIPSREGIIGYHYQLVVSSLRSLLTERRFGPKADEKGMKQRQTAAKSLEDVFNDQSRRFQSFKASSPELYRKSVQAMINTVLPVWVTYRGTYINIEEAFA